jgi:hypothetical protein
MKHVISTRWSSCGCLIHYQSEDSCIQYMVINPLCESSINRAYSELKCPRHQGRYEISKPCHPRTIKGAPNLDRLHAQGRPCRHR